MVASAFLIDSVAIETFAHGEHHGQRNPHFRQTRRLSGHRSVLSRGAVRQHRRADGTQLRRPDRRRPPRHPV
ncbi:hypothetical protein COI84_31285, partial [Priestia megaterium]